MIDERSMLAVMRVIAAADDNGGGDAGVVALAGNLLFMGVPSGR
jgi:hypothetical protein